MTGHPQDAEAQGTQEIVHALQQQAIIMKAQLDAMAASRRDMMNRLHAAGPVDAARLQELMASHDANTAELHSRLLEVNAKVAELQNGEQHSMQPPPMLPGNSGFPIDPDAITAVFLIFSIGLIVPLSVALTRRLWRRPQPAAPAGENVSSARLDRLEQAVDAIAIEVERVAESQRFVAKLLSERPSPGRATPGESGDAALREGAAFRALGAGPMEPIRVAERQAIKPSITPH